MSLPPGFLDELRSRASLSQVVGRKVMWDPRKSNQGKGDMWAPCPFHQEKSASFHVDDRKGFYYCFGCHAKGDAISFVRETENVSFMEAVEILAREAGMPMPKQDPRAQEKADKRTQLAEVMELAVQYFRLQLRTAAAGAARDYLAGRGLTPQALEQWEIGFAPDLWQGLWDHLKAKNVEDALIFGAGLAKPSSKGGRPYDTFRGRIMYPIRDARGRAIAFGGRAMDPNDNAKYLNSPETELFDKGRSLYNVRDARTAAGQGKPLIVAEGYMDVIALHQSGIHGAVATLGTASNAEHLNILFRQNNSLTLAFDGDSAGQKAAWRTLEIALPLLEDGRQLHFFILPDQHDPDSLIQSIGQEAFLEKLGQSPLLSDFLYAQLTQRFDITSPEGKGQVMGELRQLSQQLPNGSYKYLLSQSFKDRLGFGRRNAEANSNDLNLSFGGIDHSQLLMVLLLHFPKLYKAFETLRALLPEQSLIKHFLDTLDRIEEQLPQDVEACRVFVLGACSHLHPQLLPLLNKIQLSQLGMDHPEDINKHAEDLYHRLQVEFLRKKLKQPASIKEMHNLKQQLNDAYKQLSRSEIRVDY